MVKVNDDNKSTNLVETDISELEKIETQEEHEVINSACSLLGRIGMFSGVKSAGAELGELQKARLLCRDKDK